MNMKTKTSSVVLGAAIAGIIGAGATMTTPAMAKGKKAEMGLCKGMNSCAGKSACGEAKQAGNSCKGQGNAMMTKARCEKKHHEWMPAPKMGESSPEASKS